MLKLKHFDYLILDESEFDFTCLLHTYLKTSSIGNVVIHDLENLNYVDKVNGIEKVEEESELKINCEIDRVYKSAPDSVLLDLGDDQQIMLVKSNLPDLG